MLPLSFLAATCGVGLNAVDFDGSSDWLTRSSDFTGNADSKSGISHFWFRLDGGDGQEQTFWRFSPVFGVSFLSRSTDNKFNLALAAVDGTTILSVKTTTTYTASATWRHFVAAWDLATATVLIYIDGVSVADTPTTLTNATIDYTASTIAVAAGSAVGSLKLNGCIAQFYLAPGQFIDLSSAANLQKFRLATGKPAVLGGNGAVPTGTQPILFLNSTAASVGVNSGSGGDMTIHGAPAIASTSPVA